METINYKGYEIEISNEEYGFESPREWSNVGTMVCFHKRYDLPNETELKADQFNSWLELEGYIKRELKGEIILPIYMYDHSGITISTQAFHCPWDSGQIGFIFVTKEAASFEWGDDWKEKAKKYLESEVKIYDQYLTGDVWYYKIEKDGEDIDSCGGMYGLDYCRKEAKEYVDQHIQDELKKHGEQLSLDLT